MLLVQVKATRGVGFLPSAALGVTDPEITKAHTKYLCPFVQTFVC